MVVPGTGCGGEKFFSSYHGVAGLATQAPVVLHWNRKKKQDKTKKQEEYAEKILELTESKEFQTEKEQENTDNIIKKAYGNIRNLEEKKKTNIQNVEECNKKIEVLKKKLSKKPGKEEKK